MPARTSKSGRSHTSAPSTALSISLNRTLRLTRCAVAAAAAHSYELCVKGAEYSDIDPNYDTDTGWLNTRNASIPLVQDRRSIQLEYKFWNLGHLLFAFTGAIVAELCSRFDGSGGNEAHTSASSADPRRARASSAHQWFRRTRELSSSPLITH